MIIYVYSRTCLDLDMIYIVEYVTCLCLIRNRSEGDVLAGYS